MTDAMIGTSEPRAANHTTLAPALQWTKIGDLAQPFFNSFSVVPSSNVICCSHSLILCRLWNAYYG